MNRTMKAKDIIVGYTYTIKGDIQNGSYVTKENVTRKVVRVTETHVFCECGRKFIINENLNVEPFNL